MGLGIWFCLESCRYGSFYGKQIASRKRGFCFFVSSDTALRALPPPLDIFSFVGSVALENIILAGGFLPIQLRPYQFLGGILILALAILFISRRLGFRFLKPIWIDWLVFSLIPFSFLALASASNKAISLKNNLILISFAALYYLTRNFLRTREDLTKTVAFFAISFLTTILFGFYQVLADKFGAKSFEAMFGRPNSTFSEPDWLGIYLCFALAIFLTLIFYFARSRQKTFLSKKYILLFLDVLVFLDIILLILTLSRSACIGAGIVTLFYVLLNLPKPHYRAIAELCGQNQKLFFRETIIILSIILLSIISVYFGKLSKFDIFDRARSTATSEQKITIACESNAGIPASIGDVNELAKYNCRHINLEEIDYYKQQGKVVTEIFRKDPNVLTRGQIYRKSLEIIRKHPILGVGFGTITQALGVDERGAGLNESNIFLQVWAGSGIFGLIVFVAAFGYLFIYSFRRISPICPLNNIIGCPIIKDDFEKTLGVFIALGIIALIIPNLFNAGLFMGIFWLGLALIVSVKNIRSNSL